MLVMLLATAAVGANAWKLVHETPDLRVERRDYKGSELDEIKGVLRIKASLNAVMALLKDAEFNRHWVYRSGGASILEDSGYPQAYVFGIVDAPFPMLNKLSVLSGEQEKFC